METLLAGLGSEIRETLHSVMGMLELVREEPLSDAQAQYLTRCQAGADHLMSAANDVLELARGEAPVYASEPFELAGAVEEIASVMQLLAESRSQHLTWSLSVNLPQAVQGDRWLLQDTLRRLIADACDRALGGRVELTVRREGQQLMFDLCVPAERGLHEAVDASLAQRIVRKRLTHLGGRLAAAEEGVTRMEWPFLEASGGSQVQALRSPQASNGDARVAPLRLLVAEDSDDSFYLLQAYVASQGHTLARALDGAQAVEMAQTGRYDFVFMDVKMPVMDGYTATRLIREWETKQARTRLPILLLSADEAARQMRLGADVGCSGYLPKPATRAQVLSALNFYARPGAPAIPST